MRDLLIDIYRTKDPHSGLGQFSQQFAETLIAQGFRDARFTFLAPANGLNPALDGQRVLRDSVLIRPPFSRSPRFDLWHSLHQLPSHRPRKGGAWVYTVHDLNFLIEKPAVKARRYLTRLQRDLDRATVITAISRFTKAQLEKHADVKGREVRVIHNGVRFPQPGRAPLPSGIGNRPYFLCVGVLKEKKNFHVLLPLLARFPDHDLVIAGNDRTPYGDRMHREAAAAGLAGRVRLLGKVDDAVRDTLYAHCAALLVPSLAEGFGLPLVEALALGKPVFSSRSTSLPEIGGDAAFYFDSFNPETMASAVHDGLAQWERMGAEAEAVAKKHAARFSWPACMDAYLKAYATALGGTPR